MTLTLRNGLIGKKLLFKGAVSSSGATFPNPGMLAPDRNPLRGGKTEGAAPDGRELPEWVQFKWKETTYREDHTIEQLSALPIKQARVVVRGRVPQDVVDEMMESQRRREPHKLPEKSLRIYFVWFESGIKFRWELRRECCEILRAGGDEIVP